VRFSARDIAAFVARLAIAGVFLYASLPKLADPGAFAADVQNYRVLPDALVGHAALFVPVFEFVVAIGLLLPRYQRGAALIATSMLTIFSIAMAQARLRGIDLSCGCFGAAFEAKVSWLTVIRSAALGMLSAVPLILPNRAAKTQQPTA
jgi:uncharacterized membrane protein YphA (DoxX/SURF4 family)